MPPMEFVGLFDFDEQVCMMVDTKKDFPSFPEFSQVQLDPMICCICICVRNSGPQWPAVDSAAIIPLLSCFLALSRCSGPLSQNFPMLRSLWHS
jgi:hypothetical protein